MDNILIVITFISWSILLILSIYKVLLSRNLRYFITNLILLSLTLLILLKGFYFREILVSKGDSLETATIIFIGYASMILGILAQSLFNHFILSKEVRKKKKIDWSRNIAAICVSPLIFITFGASLQNIDLNNFSYANLSLFFVAFENGFFWKEVFEKHMKEKSNE